MKVKYFLNQNSLIILQIINNRPKIFTKELIEVIYDDYPDLVLRKSQTYGYIHSLELYRLISKSTYVGRRGYCYRITEDGAEILNFLIRMFEFE